MRSLIRFFGFLFAAATVVFVVGAGGAAFLIWHYSQDLPDYTQLRDYEPPVMTRVHAADGSLIAEYAKERRLYLPVQDVPKLVIDAFISAEDKNFFSHNGVDPEGITRAIIANFTRQGRRQQGASTITQQVAKNFLLSSEQTYDRKIQGDAARAAHRGDLYEGEDPRALSEPDLSRLRQLRHRRGRAQLLRQIRA